MDVPMIASSRRYQPAPVPWTGVGGGEAAAVTGEWLVIGA